MGGGYGREESEGALCRTRNALYLDLGDGYVDVHISKKFINCTLMICMIYYMRVIPQCFCGFFN